MNFASWFVSRGRLGRIHFSIARLRSFANMSNGQSHPPEPAHGNQPVPPAPTVEAAPPPPPPPTATPPVPKTVYVIFSAEITQQTTESLMAVMANCATQGVQHVYLVLSTPGGDVNHGITLYNALRGMPFELSVHNVGNVDSIGNVIFLAGSARYATKHSTFMFHGVGFSYQNQTIRFEEKNVREMITNIESNHDRIGSILEERTQLTNPVIKELFREAQTKDATYAIGCGIVQEIRDLQIPTGSTVISLVFQR
jgi:ATP-dependent Clp protease protease subunit